MRDAAASRLSVVALACLVHVAAAAQQPAPPGFTPPTIVTRVQPQYTAEALRARIQGFVDLRATVEVDGTVSDVQVVRSLDAVNGLDQAAVDAVKQWRYTPAMKAGVPVRLTFTIRVAFNIPGMPPVLTWPEGFEQTGGSEKWVEHSSDASGLTLRIGYPADWTLDTSGPAQQLLRLHVADGTRIVDITTPRPAPFQIAEPFTGSRLQEFGDLLSRTLGGSYETRAVGQVIGVDRTLWVWLEAEAPVREMRVWTFAATPAGRFVTVTCTLLYRRGSSEEEKQQRLRTASAEFGAILRRLTATLPKL